MGAANAGGNRHAGPREVRLLFDRPVSVVGKQPTAIFGVTSANICLKLNGLRSAGATRREAHDTLWPAGKTMVGGSGCC